MNVRLQRYREELERAGGRRVIVDLPADGAAALEAIRKRDGSTMKAAITDALVSFAREPR